MGNGYNETVLEGEWNKMRIYEATIADLDGLASVFNNYRMFYRQDSDLEGAKVFLRNRMERKESVIFVAVKTVNILDSRNYIHHFLLFR